MKGSILYIVVRQIKKLCEEIQDSAKTKPEKSQNFKEEDTQVVF